jgi:hypothetical protein
MKHKTLWGLVLAMGGLFGALLLAQPIQDPLFHSFRSGDPSAGIYWGTAFPTEANTGAPPPDGALFIQRTADAGGAPELFIYSDFSSAWLSHLMAPAAGLTDNTVPVFNGTANVLEDSGITDTGTLITFTSTDVTTTTTDDVTITVGDDFSINVTGDDLLVNTADEMSFSPSGQFTVNLSGTDIVSVLGGSGMTVDTGALTADTSNLILRSTPAVIAAGEVTDMLFIDAANTAVHTGGTLNAIRIDNVGVQAVLEQALHVEAGWTTTLQTDDLILLQTPGDIDLTSANGIVEVTAGVLMLPDGTFGAPSLTFTSDPNTGIYSFGADSIGFTTGGALRGAVSSSGRLNWVTTGTAVGPAFTTGNDPNTGLWNPAADQMAVAAGGATVLTVAATNAAGAGADLVTISSTLGIMDDAADVVRGLNVALTNVNHTGGNVYGIDIPTLAGTGADAQAAEYALNFGTGWDYDISFNGRAGSITLDAAVGEIDHDTTNATWGHTFSAGGALLLRMDGDGGAAQTFNSQGSLGDIDHGVNAHWLMDPTLAANDNANDQRNVLLIDVVVPDGSAGLVNAIGIDGVTDDANTIDSAIFVEGGWDSAITITDAGHAFTSNPLTGTVFITLDDSTDYSGAGGVDCWLVLRDANGNDHQIVEVVLNGACP